MKLNISVTTLVAFLALSTAAKKCAKPAVRKEIRELSTKEVKTLTRAMAELHKAKGKNGLSKHEEFTKLHNENVSSAHEVPAFLPWHRHFTREYEKALQQIEPSVVLPYWDWSLDSQAPQDSIVFTDDYIGGNGNPDNGYCMESGPFKGWQMSYPFDHCLKRSFNLGKEISPLSYPEEISLYLNEPTFSKFSLLFEEKHGYPHIFIGGPAGDFRPTYSPNDPIFFLHHAFIDYVYFQWQKRHPEAVQYEKSSYYNYKPSASIDDTLVPYNNVTIKSLLDTEEEYYCYTYEGDYPRFIFPEGTTKKVKDEVGRSIKDNIILGDVLKNSTMEKALDYLGSHFNESVPYSKEKRVNTPGMLYKDWAAVIGFTMPEQLEKNSRDSALLAQHLARVPGFKSLAHFGKYLKH